MATAYKVLAQWAPSGTGFANMYTVPANTSAVVSTIHIANVTASDTTVTVRVLQPGGSVITDETALFKNLTIPANSFYAFTEGITLQAGVILNVSTSIASSAVFHVFGSEIS
jgi:hypothetical protein